MINLSLFLDFYHKGNEKRLVVSFFEIKNRESSGFYHKMKGKILVVGFLVIKIENLAKN